MERVAYSKDRLLKVNSIMIFLLKISRLAAVNFSSLVNLETDAHSSLLHLPVKLFLYKSNSFFYLINMCALTEDFHFSYYLIKCSFIKIPLSIL